MTRIVALFIGLLAVLAGVPHASAQRLNANVVTSCGAVSPFPTLNAGTGSSLFVDTNGNTCISGSISASFSSFTPTPAYATPLTVGATSSRVALPSGTVVAVYNTGTNAAFVTLGNGSVVATASDDQIAPGGFMCFGVGSAVDLAAIETAGGTVLNISGGSGGCAGSGGGGGGGGGGGSNASVGTTGTAVPGSGTYIGMNVSGNLTGAAGSANGMYVDASQATLTVSQPANGSFGSSGPGTGVAIGVNSPGTLAPLIQTTASAPINISTAVTTQLVALSSGKVIYVTGWNVIAGGTGNITLEYGTGSLCSGSTTVLTGAYNLTAQAGISYGNGLGPVFVVPASNALCAVTSAAVQMSGSVSYTQF